MKNRGFKVINKKYINEEINADNLIMPTRSTTKSAGYDFYSPVEVVFKPNEVKMIKTYMKAWMKDDEFLAIYIRSSMAIKRGLTLVNSVAIIDSDYYENESNDGHIMLAFKNNTQEEVVIKQNEKIAQGIFQKYLVCDDDNTTDKKRTGGIGSTGV